MAVFRAVVDVQTGFLLLLGDEIRDRGTVGFQPISDDCCWRTVVDAPVTKQAIGTPALC